MGHGKVEHDGVGVYVKRALRRYQMSHDVNQLKSVKMVTITANKTTFVKVAVVSSSSFITQKVTQMMSNEFV